MNRRDLLRRIAGVAVAPALPVKEVLAQTLAKGWTPRSGVRGLGETMEVAALPQPLRRQYEHLTRLLDTEQEKMHLRRQRSGRFDPDIDCIKSFSLVYKHRKQRKRDEEEVDFWRRLGWKIRGY